MRAKLVSSDRPNVINSDIPCSYVWGSRGCQPRQPYRGKMVAKMPKKTWAWLRSVDGEKLNKSNRWIISKELYIVSYAQLNLQLEGDPRNPKFISLRIKTLYWTRKWVVGVFLVPKRKKMNQNSATFFWRALATFKFTAVHQKLFSLWVWEHQKLKARQTVVFWVLYRTKTNIKFA